ncbi:MAG: hypothetical protein M3N30_06510, partial [Bacteroidota bacterium]|nr:hypothetical protein [Bacteroidota bacterium]
MKRKIFLWSWPLWITLFCNLPCSGQATGKILSLTDALEIASANYLIHSKMNYTKSSAKAV